MDTLGMEAAKLMNSKALDVFFGNPVIVYALYILIAVTAVLLILRGTRKTAVLVAISFLITWISGEQILKNVIGRVRPFIEYGLTVIIKRPESYSFPSGHAAMSFAVAGVFLFTGHRYRKTFLAFAVYVSISRVYLNVHYLTDILGGVLLGLSVSYMTVRWIGRWLQDKVYYRRSKGNQRIKT
ncbi:phosphatase PAP2 family protein [Youngiibacter multivorans]|uniref:Undecaprenyl-diphosphatase n=1 Tax=Youngiibacter multivorans TaxID=937251 RepID=A0ABS4G608_9CLOT|nr:phosphatase PAP2 family protein [Youngiibacter multivorans]MBP1919987.1 undecaprenyl-diphosphatase [Youngiibacter multivorans]